MSNAHQIVHALGRGRDVCRGPCRIRAAQIASQVTANLDATRRVDAAALPGCWSSAYFSALSDAQALVWQLCLWRYREV
jgi:hypothetical protein